MTIVHMATVVDRSGNTPSGTTRGTDTHIKSKLEEIKDNTAPA